MKKFKRQCKECKSSEEIVESACKCSTVRLLCVTCFQLRVIQHGINCRCDVNLSKAHVDEKLVIPPITDPYGHVYCVVGAGVGNSSLHFKIPADDRPVPPTYLLKGETVHHLKVEESGEPRTYTVVTEAGNKAIIEFAEDFRTATYTMISDDKSTYYRLNTYNQLINDYCRNMKARKLCPKPNCKTGQLKFIHPECGHFACTDCMESKS